MNIDLNADIGEGFDEDAEILKSITSANVACGFHAGDAPLIFKTISLALHQGVSVGAHPSLNDREHFGRLELKISPDDLLADLIYQIGAVHSITSYLGGTLAHVKPHGALYHMAERDPATAEVICKSVAHFGPNVALFALSMGSLAATAGRYGIRVAHEVFADRSVEPDGSLTPRTQPGAVLTDPKVVTLRIIGLLRDGTITATNGDKLSLKADTICFHGDTPGSSEFARQVRSLLSSSGVHITHFG